MVSCDLRGAGLAKSASDVPLPPAYGPDQERAAASIVLGGGCFWCVEAVFKELHGVTGVVSGYAGGAEDDADYRSVCSGQTGHAEVVRVDYDPRKIDLGEILRVFFTVAHDPTQRDRQGNDRGRQYRSAIFWSDEPLREYCGAYIRQLDEGGYFQAPIATTLEPLDAFFEAEAYHQGYAARNPGQAYVAYTAAPKVAKLRKEFASKVKS